MRTLILAAFAAALLWNTPVQAACDQFDRMGWTCSDQGFFTQRAHTHKATKRARGVDPKLMSAYRYVASRCRGVRVVSGVRKTRVRGYRRYVRSLHWTGNALDFKAASYRCAYAALRSYGWKGGWSRDGTRCRHIHISYGGRRPEPPGFRHRRC